MTRTRPATTVLASLLAGLSLSVGVAACGGEQIAADEVAAPPPELTLPTEGDEKGADALAGDDSGSDTDTGSTSTNGDDTSTTEDSSTDSSGGAPAGGGTSGSTGGAPAAPQSTPAPSNPGGTQAPAQQQDDSANDTAPQPGSGAEKFEEFCQQNAGAC